MSGKKHSCKCQDRIITLEENLALLKNLFVGQDLLVNGDLLINGRIINNTTERGTYLCTTGIVTSDITGKVFNINQANPCRIIIQGPFTTTLTRVIYGPATPDGFYYIINASTQAVVSVEDVNSQFAPYVVESPTNPNNPAVIRLRFVSGAIVQDTEIGPVIIGNPSVGCQVSTSNGGNFDITNNTESPCSFERRGQVGFLVAQRQFVVDSPSFIVYGPATTGTLIVENSSTVQPVNIVDIRTMQISLVVPPALVPDGLVRTVVVFLNGVITSVTQTILP